MDFKFNLVI